MSSRSSARAYVGDAASALTIQLAGTGGIMCARGSSLDLTAQGLWSGRSLGPSCRSRTRLTSAEQLPAQGCAVHARQQHRRDPGRRRRQGRWPDWCAALTCLDWPRRQRRAQSELRADPGLDRRPQRADHLWRSVGALVAIADSRRRQQRPLHRRHHLHAADDQVAGQVLLVRRRCRLG